MASQTVPRHSVASTLRVLLDSPELSELTEELDALRWTGRKGYGSRALIGACLVKSLYAIPDMDLRVEQGRRGIWWRRRSGSAARPLSAARRRLLRSMDLNRRLAVKAEYMKV